VFFNIMCISW